jgi:hypothetical protein
LVIGGGAKNPKIMCPRGKECGYSREVSEPSPGAAPDGARASSSPPRPDSPAPASP